MDIEGAEYTALIPAIASGSLCATVDELQLELHDKHLARASTRNVSFDAAYAHHKDGHAQRLRELIREVETARKAGRCRTRVIVLNARNV